MDGLDKNNEIEDNTATPSQPKFSPEALEALQELGKVLRRIHNRLVSEGVEIKVDKHYENRSTDK